MQATSDNTASANFTQTGFTSSPREENFTYAPISGGTYGKTGYQPYYQWGRKDAFRSNQYTTAPAANTSLVYSATVVTVGTAIQNPTTIYSRGENLYSTMYYNVWNATYTSYSDTASNIEGLNKTVKTVYDPCPVGYTVSSVNTFTGLNTSNSPVDGNGRKYTINGKTLYIPYCGARNSSYGALDGGHNSQCLYWLSSACSSGNSWYIRFNSTTATYSTGGGRAWGLAIRPVREN